jgi:membrane protein implicated in regulation of membrane protease activity
MARREPFGTEESAEQRRAGEEAASMIDVVGGDVLLRVEGTAWRRSN